MAGDVGGSVVDAEQGTVRHHQLDPDRHRVAMIWLHCGGPGRDERVSGLVERGVEATPWTIGTRPVTWTSLFEVDTGLAEPLAWGLVGYVDSAATRWVDNPGATSFEQMSDFLARGIWAILDGSLRRYGLTLDPHEPLTL